MFALNPHGQNSSGGKSDSAPNKYMHFVKLGLYFVAVRATYVYFSAGDKINATGSR